MTTRLAPRPGAGGTTHDDPVRLLADVTPDGRDGEAWAMAVDVFVPDPGTVPQHPVVLCCLPGGGVDRRYYDLRVASDDTYSFARHLTRHGITVVVCDHLGVGESSEAPAEQLTVEVLAAAAHRAMTAVVAEFAADALSVGVGHSMGAMLTVEQQATHRTHGALALLGFGNRGLPDLLHPDVVALAGDPEELRRRIPELWRRQQEERAAAPPPPPEANPRRDGRRAGAPFFHGEHLPEDVVAAVKGISAAAPGMAALTSMVPGSVKREMASIDVPMLLANGELDFTGPIHEIASGFASCHDLTLLELPGAGHSHHAFPARLQLWERLAAWTRSLPYAVR